MLLNQNKTKNIRCFSKQKSMISNFHSTIFTNVKSMIDHPEGPNVQPDAIPDGSKIRLIAIL